METPIISLRPKTGHRSRLTALLAILFAAGPSAALAVQSYETNGKPLLACSADLSTNSRYLWRGMPLSQGPVFQPSAGFSYGGLSLSLWGNFDFDSRLERPGLNEVDVFLTYSWALEGLTIEPGLSLYTYPRQTPGSPGTTEATLYVSVPLAGPVSAYLDQAVDIGAYAGGYFADAGLSLETGVCANVSIEASLSQTFGSTTFNSAYWEISRSMLDACALKLVLTWSLARKLSLSPRLDIVALTSSGLRRAAGRNSYFNLGLTLGVGVE